MERIRAQLPSLANRQPAAYTWPGGGLGAPARRGRRASSSTSTSRSRSPGPLLGPEGYRRAGERHGLDLDPEPLLGRPRGGRRGPRAPSRSSSTTRRSGSASRRTSSAAWAGRGRACEVAPRRSRTAGTTRRTSSSTRTSLPVLAELRRRGLKIGLVSNTSRDLGAFVDHFSLDVDAWVSSGVHGKVKPSPTHLPRRPRAARRRAGRGRHGRRLARRRRRGRAGARDARLPPRPRGSVPGPRRHAPLRCRCARPAGTSSARSADCGAMADAGDLSSRWRAARGRPGCA